MAKRRTDSHCFALGCRTGYPGAPKASLFAAPRDDELLSKWERNLRRADKSLTEVSAVCEHHFEAHCILRDYVHVIDGVEVRIPRGKPSLAPNAIPTLLPQCPAYLSVKTPNRVRKGKDMLVIQLHHEARSRVRTSAALTMNISCLESRMLQNPRLSRFRRSVD
ncbi:hypothetical protein HPB49_020921 [Dermacentor silvarum]|uniref:Uncharacterized protein n=1 Tax=Dermacentor silvarum TaxID=543639 RepID=A0ACB8C5B1_DERSI|nr:hypothetical protein HPB49_020921 [Dermacentor silvarum]